MSNDKISVPFTPVPDDLAREAGAIKATVISAIKRLSNGTMDISDISHREIGYIIGLERSTVSKTIKQLEADGFIISSSPSRRQSNHNPGYVYLLCRPQDGAFKIGLSIQPETRLNQIREYFPGTVLVHLIKTDDMQNLENELHQIFADYRLDGEWFNLPIEGVNSIKQL